jgi:hypothetical protein
MKKLLQNKKESNKLIYVATGNLSKLRDIQLFCSWFDPELRIEIVPDFIAVDESGATLAENSRLKVLPYLAKYQVPVLAVDSGLYFDEQVVEIQDPIKIKRNALAGKSESELSQEAVAKLMLDYYKGLARKYGGKIDCQMRNVFTILLPDGRIKQNAAQCDYQLVDREVTDYDIYHPLNCLRISKLTGKFMGEMSEAEEKIDKAVLANALKELILIP